MKICFVTSEVAPFAKTGGLADVSAGLARYLARHGHDVRVFLPFYSRIESAGHPFTAVDFLADVPLALGAHAFRFSVYAVNLPGSDLDVYLVGCPALYDRPGIYTSDADEHLRFLLLTRAAVECCQRMGWGPEVFHLHDWHTAFLPLYLRTLYAWDRLFAASKTLLTIHNVGYQGVFPAAILPDLDLAGDQRLLHQERLAAGRISFLETGVLYADMLSTVSRTHAREIQTPEYGMGLDGALRARADHLVGIVNGVDYGEWDPAHDPFLPRAYGPHDLSAKVEARDLMLDRLGLAPAAAEVPVLGVVSRLTYQKGVELFFEVLPEALARRDLRLAVVGSGEIRYEQFFARLQSLHPGRVCFYRGYSNELAHLVEAGSDLFLMPSRYEPCGLNQMYSLKYGTVPVVRKTGGLADTVELYDWRTRRGTGFVFEQLDAQGLDWALGYALETFRHREAWEQIMRNGMAKDFSWEIQGQEYVALYRSLIGG